MINKYRLAQHFRAKLTGVSLKNVMNVKKLSHQWNVTINTWQSLQLASIPFVRSIKCAKSARRYMW
jgi:hydrogenase-4 membrane subunit HyfE